MNEDFESGSQILTKPKHKRPSMYGVLFLNDDYTTMQFVIKILMNVFHLSLGDASVIMLKIHREGKAMVGRFTFEVANEKADLTNALARQNEFPLLVAPEDI